jgi:hypothetical protein
LVNTFANGWIIDISGEYEVDIYYTPQKYLDVALPISLYSIAAVLIYLTVRKIKGAIKND